MEGVVLYRQLLVTVALINNLDKTIVKTLYPQNQMTPQQSEIQTRKKQRNKMSSASPPTLNKMTLNQARKAISKRILQS